MIFFVENETKNFTPEEIEHSLITDYKYFLWRKFTKALKVYDLIQSGDRILVCISGGKDSMLLALLFKHLKKYTDVPFDVKYMVMDPGYNKENMDLIYENLRKLHIEAAIVKTDIFQIANNTDRKPCYLCAKMRRGALYRIATELGCNKIALGHHYDDVIETTLMNLLNAGSFQTMLPKLHSDNYQDVDLIRPLYFIREKDIISWAKNNNLHFIRCACRFTEIYKNQEEEEDNISQRYKTKLLIQELKKTYSPVVEKNLFRAGENVNLDMVLGYKENGKVHSFLADYEEKGKENKEKIQSCNLQEQALEKALKEHKALIIDESYFYLKEEK